MKCKLSAAHHEFSFDGSAYQYAIRTYDFQYLRRLERASSDV